MALVDFEEQTVAVEGTGCSFDSGTGLVVVEGVGYQGVGCSVVEYLRLCFAKYPLEYLAASLAVACHAVVVRLRRKQHQNHVRR